MPGPKMMPCELRPAATNSPATSAVSPSRKLASGVKLSGAFRKWAKAASFRAGMRCRALASGVSKCGQSGSNSPNAKSGGIVAGDLGLASGSKAPITSPPR